MVFPSDILLWRILPKKVDAEISPCVPSPFELPCSRILVPFTNRKPARVVSLQPDLNLKGPLITVSRCTEDSAQSTTLALHSFETGVDLDVRLLYNGGFKNATVGHPIIYFVC